MQFSIKSVLVFITGAAVGSLLSKRAAAIYDDNTPNMLIALLVGAMGAWGLGYGALFGGPCRGMVIGALSAAVTLYGYELLMMFLVYIRW
jgi:hypothetical protein